MTYDLPVAVQVFEVSDQDQLKEHKWINAGVTFRAIVIFGLFTQKFEIQVLLEPPVEIIGWHPVRKLKASEELFGILLFALHTLIYKGCEGCQALNMRINEQELLVVVQQAQPTGATGREQLVVGAACLN
jgi:hypothetical protein